MFQFFHIFRYLADEETLIYVANFGEGSYRTNIVTDFDNTMPSSMKVKITSLDSSIRTNIPLATTSLSLAPGEAVILGTQ